MVSPAPAACLLRPAPASRPWHTIPTRRARRSHYNVACPDPGVRMRRVVWMTDIHLNFLEPPALPLLEDLLRRAAPDVILLGGDIAEAPQLPAYLRSMAERLSCPLCFVLGNHDFYGGSIARVRREVVELCRELPRLVYLSANDV